MPKFVEVPVFTIGEQPEKARDKAHSDYLSDGFDFDYSDNISTIKSFCDLFDIDLQNWSVDSCSYSYDATIPKQRNLTKRKALAMVSSWEITQGYFLASVACDAIKTDWQYGDAYKNDIEYQESVECFIDMCEANEWTFMESGELFHV